MIIRENEESIEKYKEENIIHHSTINSFYSGIFYASKVNDLKQ